MRVLVVDDDPLVQQLMQAVLAAKGWGVELASSGHEALSACRGEPADVVVLDHHMSGMTGIEVAQVLRSEGFDRPIIMFSAMHNPELDDEARALDIPAVSKTDLDVLVRMAEELAGSGSGPAGPDARARRGLLGRRRPG